MPQLVHSLWVSLWKQKKFSPEHASDLRKRSLAGVEKKFFCGTFIHSLQPAAVHWGMDFVLRTGRFAHLP
ncbi:MAG: hypothetical protein JWQ75_386 [Pseudarthrobacter sp.]|nr:hypothetical protein [Pseudarthrobacter sp.]